MNREIRFRGKRCKDGEWVYGSYVESNKSWRGCKPHKSWILPSPMTNGGWFSIRGAYPVKEETVCQYTGLKDKNGIGIYEGDIVKCYHLFNDEILFITWCDERVRFLLTERPDDYSWYLCPNDVEDIEVISNIHDSPELLKGDGESNINLNK